MITLLKIGKLQKEVVVFFHRYGQIISSAILAHDEDSGDQRCQVHTASRSWLDRQTDPRGLSNATIFCT